MSIDQLKNRTKTYLAGDWTGDYNAIEQIHKWNESDHYGLHFKDVHEYTQSYDTSNYCNIKKSLKKRMDISKKFVLIVGKDTDSLTKGSCRYCCYYQTYHTIAPKCKLGYAIDNRSYIQYECEMALKAGIEIVVLYNDTKVNKNLCPEVLRNIGTHKEIQYRGEDGKLYWDYQAVKDSIM